MENQSSLRTKTRRNADREAKPGGSAPKQDNARRINRSKTNNFENYRVPAKSTLVLGLASSSGSSPESLTRGFVPNFNSQTSGIPSPSESKRGTEVFSIYEAEIASVS
jgi:hypothetical protein